MQYLSFYNLYAYHFSLSYLPPVMQITTKYIRLIPDARRALAHASMVLPFLVGQNHRIGVALHYQSQPAAAPSKAETNHTLR